MSGEQETSGTEVWRYIQSREREHRATVVTDYWASVGPGGGGMADSHLLAYGYTSHLEMNLFTPILADGALTGTGIALNVAMLILLVSLSGLFSGSETVLFSLTRLQLERAAASPNPFRRLAAGLMEHPKRTLLTILVANTAVNIALFANSYVFFRQLAARVDSWWVTPLSGIASIMLVVVFGEVVPKVLGVGLADQLAPVSATAVRAVSVVATPLGRLIDAVLAEPFARVVLGARRRDVGEHLLSPDELKALLELSRRSGVLRPLEDSFLRPIIDLSVTRVRDVMVPRVEMTAYDVNASAKGLRELMRETHYRKVPVYQGTRDNIIGLVYAKVLYLNSGKPLRKLVQPVQFVPELATCEQLLMHFRGSSTQLAVVVDEYGGVAGLVTLEDVLEQIVGELYDPEDEFEAPEIQALPDGGYEISGQLSMQYWAEAFDLPPQVERVATVGGLVMAKLGRLARVDDVVRLGNVELRVVKLHRRAIDRLHLRLLPEPEKEPAA